MAKRDYAQLYTRIWSDEDFRELSPAGQRLYMLLLSQSGLNYAGVIAVTIRRWAKCSVHTTVGDVKTALAELEQNRFVVIDDDTDELLVRTFIRNDELWKQPRMLGLAIREALEVASPRLRYELGRELGRLPDSVRVDSGSPALDVAINQLMAGYEPPPGVSHDDAQSGRGAGGDQGHAAGHTRACARGTLHQTPVPDTDGGAVKNLTTGRAREEDPACDHAPAITPATAPPGPAITGPKSGDGFRLVNRVVGLEHPPAVRTALAIEASTLLLNGTDSDLIIAALELWLTKPKCGPRTLPSLVSEVIKTRNAAANPPPQQARPSTTDQRVAAILALRDQMCGPGSSASVPELIALPGGAA